MSSDERVSAHEASHTEEDKHSFHEAQPRTMRPNRGAKMRYLVEKEDLIDENDEFWGKEGKLTEIFKEETNDTEFVDTSSEESEDSSDSDIDDPENEIDEAKETDEDVKEQPQKKRKNVYVDPLRKKAKTATRTKSEENAPPTTEKLPKEEKSLPSTVSSEEDDKQKQKKESDEEVETKENDNQRSKKERPVPIPENERPHEQRTLRQSTIQYSEERRIMREIEREVLEEKRAQRRRKKRRIRKLTQEQLLKEAKITEELNKQSLAEMLKIEEIKKRLPPSKPKIVGPKIVYRSTAKGDTVTFTEVDEFPSFLNGKSIPYPSRSLCMITGLPAKYLDPKTNVPFATIETFKMIRSRQDKTVTEARRQSEMQQRNDNGDGAETLVSGKSSQHIDATPKFHCSPVSNKSNSELESLPFVQNECNPQSSESFYIVNLT